jgi:AraC-like DNA-binding protein
VTIIAVLPPRLLRHLKLVASGRYHVVPLGSWTEMERFIATHPVGVAVVDPSMEGSGTQLELEQLAAAHPSIPLIGYVPLNPAAFRAVADLSGGVLAEVVLYAHEDDTKAFRSTIERLQASSLTNRMLAALQPKLKQLPIALAKSVTDLFQEPHRYLSAHDLAVSSELPTSRLYRCFESVALASPKRVLIAAKLLRGYQYLTDPGHSVHGVSLKLGYRKPRIFTDQTQEVFGLNPSRLTLHMNEEMAFSTLLKWCIPA